MGECSDNVETMALMTEHLTHLERFLRRPMWFDVTTGGLKVLFTSAQPVSISGTNTLTTVTNLTNMGGFAIADSEIRYQMKDKWANCVRNRVS